MKEKIYLTLIFLGVILVANAQVGVKLIHLTPVGEFGFTMKSTFSGELLYMADETEGLSFRAGVSYCSFSPRMDTFPVYTVVYDPGNKSMIYPGKQVYNNYNMYLLFAGMDYKFNMLDPFYFYPGLDIITGGVDMDYTIRYPTDVLHPLIDKTFTGSEILAGLRVRAGVGYRISDLVNTFIEAQQSLYIVSKTGIYSHYDLGLGLTLFIF